MHRGQQLDTLLWQKRWVMFCKCLLTLFWQIVLLRSCLALLWLAHHPHSLKSPSHKLCQLIFAMGPILQRKPVSPFVAHLFLILAISTVKGWSPWTTDMKCWSALKHLRWLWVNLETTWVGACQLEFVVLFYKCITGSSLLKVARTCFRASWG